MFRSIIFFFICIAFSTPLLAATSQITDIKTIPIKENFALQNLSDDTDKQLVTAHLPASSRIYSVESNVQLSQVPLPATIWLLAPILIWLTQLRQKAKK